MSNSNNYEKVNFALTLAGFIGSVLFYAKMLHDTKKRPSKETERISELEQENKQLKAVIIYLIKQKSQPQN